MTRINGTSAPIGIAICDGDPLARGALAGFVGTWPDCRLISTGQGEAYLVQAMAEPCIDVILVDAHEVRVCQQAAIRRRAKFIYLAARDDPALAADLACGIVEGLISKDTDPNSMGVAVRGVHRGLLVASGGQLSHLRPPPDPGLSPSLSPRQAQVLVLVCRGWSNARIASTMHLSASSIKVVVSDLLRLMNAGNRVALALLAAEKGLVTTGGLVGD